VGSFVTWSPVHAASVSTDSLEYDFESTVAIRGSSFLADETVHLVITFIDGTPLPLTVQSSWDVVADGTGTLPSDGGVANDADLGNGDFSGFLTDWIMSNDINSGDTLLLTATGDISGAEATTTFVCKKYTVHQLQNGSTSASPAWAYGNINSTNSCYGEGSNIPYRFFAYNLLAGSTHTFKIIFQATKGGIHALDYLSEYDMTEAGPILSTGGECGDIVKPAPTDCSAPVAVVALPDPRLLSSYVSMPPADIADLLNPLFAIDGPGSLYAYNATNVSLSQISFDGTSSDRLLELTVTFEAISNGSVGFFWGGHLAEGQPDSWGAGQGASSIGGAPYHMSAGELDGQGGMSSLSVHGLQICLPPDVTITCDPGPYCVGSAHTCSVPTGADTYAWTVTGGTILSGQGTPTITYTITAATGDPVTVSVVACNIAAGCASDFCCSEATAQFIADDCCTVDITCPPDATIECDESTDPGNTGTATYTVAGSCPTPITISYTDTETAGACPQEKTITRLWKVIDGNNQVQAQCPQTITVVDNSAPVLAGCPGNMTVECNAVPTPASVTATDNCDPAPVVTFSETTVAGTCDQKYTLTRTWTATDACGNVSSCTHTITVQDTQAPQITCPAPITVECLADVPVPNPVLVTAADACDPNPVVTFVGDVSDGQTCPETITRTYQAVDDCGNFATCTQTITIDDTTPPQVTCPAAVTVQCAGDVPAPNVSLVTVTDNCDPDPVVTFVGDVSDGQTCPETITRTYKAVDDCGNFATCTQTITIDDTTPPVITCPSDVTVLCNDPTDPPHTGTPAATDNCSAVGAIAISYSDASSGGSITRTWTATDECGNQAACVQTITIEGDIAPPQITCPVDVSVECLTDVPAPDPGSVVVSDNCDSNPLVTHEGDVQSGTTCPITITRTYRATDASGNFAECDQVITVNDQTPPQLTCPDPITVPCPADVPAPNPTLVTAWDNCGGMPTVEWVSDNQQGSCPTIVTRVYKATDDCGNEAFCQQTITVDDQTAPQLTCPPTVTVQCPADVPAPDPGLVTATDNCDPTPLVTFVSDVSDGLSCPETITRTYQATDACGNVGFCTQTITIDDTIAPQITCPADVTVDCMAEVPLPDIGSVGVIDNCDPAPVIVFVSDVPNGSGCPITITRTYKATDFCDNVGYCTQTITVDDITPPDVTCPGPVTVECIGDVPPPDIGLVMATDNCDPDPIVEWVSDVSDGLTCPETITRTYKATDDCDNVGYCTQTITVDDITPPQITCPNDITVGCLTDVPDPDINLVTVDDNCDPAPVVTFVSDQQSGTGCPIIITRTYRAVDACDKEAFCTQIITVDDQEPPELIGCPVDVTVECDDVPPVANVTATDNCDGDLAVAFSESTTPGDCAYRYTVRRVWSATDACGNESQCIQVITVDDTTPPEITCPANATVECLSDVPQPDIGLVTATDNCDPDPVVEWVDDDLQGTGCPMELHRTYKATDDCNNEAFCTRIFILDDQTPPVFTIFPSDQDTIQCQPAEICLDVAAEDNCGGRTILSVADGPGDIVGDQWCYTPPPGSAFFDVTIRAEDTCSNYVEDVFHVDIIVNTPPSFTNCPTEDLTVHWGKTFEYDFTVTDPDAGQTLAFSLCPDAPEGAEINEATGHLEWPSTADDICDPTICVIVTDDCGAADTCEFYVCVTNDPPVITCPDDVTICHGYPLETQVTADDPDGGPYKFFYLVSGPAGVEVNANSGAVTWVNPEPGAWEICVTVTDSTAVCDPCSPANADTCCFTLNVVSLDLVIEKVHGQLQGQYTDVSIDFMHQGSNWPVAGFDFLIQYDAGALSFQVAREGQFLLECEWEYFTYRFGVSGNCGGGACPSGVLRVVAMAESTGGNLADHPDCFSNDGIPNPGPGSTTATELAVLTFLVSNDRTLECQYVPIRFVWYDCGDNGLSNTVGDTLHISNQVYDYGGELGEPPVVQWNDITGLDNSFPTLTGAPSPDCDISDKFELIRCANFYNGGVDIICADDIDAPGDVNLNGIAYEIADAVMFTNYFIVGLSAFGDHVDGSIAATDANRDGVTLSVADLVHIIRVVIGDAQQYAKVTPGVVHSGYSVDDGVVTVADDVEISGAALVVRGEVIPGLLVDGMDMSYVFDGANTRIVVTPTLEATTLGSFRGSFLAGITDEVISIELATSQGALVEARNIPVRYRLSQNYPNPFNPVTTIEFALPMATPYRLNIYNIQGQVVDAHEGRAEAPGVFHYEWDGSDLASGVYLYRLEAGDFIQTKKMLMLK